MDIYHIIELYFIKLTPSIQSSSIDGMIKINRKFNFWMRCYRLEIQRVYNSMEAIL